MVLLPVIYVALIGLVGWGIYYHAVNHVGILSVTRNGRGVALAALVYAAPFVAGGILVLFMLKPLFSRHTSHFKTRSLNRASEPVLFAFIDRICQAVGAPQPARVDLDLQVNASASFRRGMLSFLGNDMVLTIGLPLLAGMSLREFGGVLAHEFGHFAQGAGMRLTYLIRSISRWFTRVVYERDDWDDWLRRTAEEVDIRIGWVLYVSILFVWLTRKILWCLMMVGHMVSGLMLRQMEFSADRFETRLAGSDTFAQTARRLRELGLAMSAAQSDFADFRREGRLADNLPKLIMANARQLPAPAQLWITEQIASAKTSWLDTHPADSERIANAARENTQGVFRLDWPASLLLTDFDTQSRFATLELYRDIFDGRVDLDALHPVDDLIQRQDAETASIKGVGRYFQNTCHALRPLPLPAWQAVAPRNPQAAVQRLAVCRDQLQTGREQYEQSFEQYDAADTLALHATQARALLKAGLKFPKDAFRVEMKTDAAASETRRKAQVHMERLDDELLRFESAHGERLATALQLLFTPEVAARIETAAPLQREAAKLTPIFNLVSSLLKTLWKLRDEHAVLNVLASSLRGNERNQSLIAGVRGAMENCLIHIRNLRGPLERLDYPLEHAKGKVSLAEYVLNQVPEADDLGGIYQAGEELLEALPRLYVRLLAALAKMAESAEEAVGLPPLPESVRE